MGTLRSVLVGTALAATVAGCSPQPEAVSPYAPPPSTEEDAAAGEDESPYAPVPPVDDLSPVPAYAAAPPVDEP